MSWSCIFLQPKEQQLLQQRLLICNPRHIGGIYFTNPKQHYNSFSYTTGTILIPSRILTELQMVLVLISSGNNIFDQVKVADFFQLVYLFTSSDRKRSCSIHVFLANLKSWTNSGKLFYSTQGTLPVILPTPRPTPICNRHNTRVPCYR